MRSILSMSVAERMRLQSTLGHFLPDPVNASPSDFIAAAEEALRQYPKEWLILSVLVDKYQNIGHYTAALRYSKQLVELCPDDALPAYAHATSYNLLTRAGWPDAYWRAYQELVQRNAAPDHGMDGKRAQEQLSEVGLTPEAAAGEAVYWFERALTLDVDEPSKRQIREDLDTLYRRFPCLVMGASRGPVRVPEQGDAEAVWHNFGLHVCLALGHVNTAWPDSHLDPWSRSYQAEQSRLQAEAQSHLTLGER